MEEAVAKEITFITNFVLLLICVAINVLTYPEKRRSIR